MIRMNCCQLQQFVTVLTYLYVALLPILAGNVSQDDLTTNKGSLEPGDSYISNRETYITTTESTRERGFVHPPTTASKVSTTGKNTRDHKNPLKSTSEHSSPGKNRKGDTGTEFPHLPDKPTSKHFTYEEQQKAESTIHKLKDSYHKTSDAGYSIEDEADDDLEDEDGAMYDLHDASDDDDGWMYEMQSDFPSRGISSKGGKKKMFKRPRMNRKNNNNNMEGYSYEYRIKNRLLHMSGYDKTTRPVKNDSTTTTVYLGMSLFHILNTNEKMQTLSALIAIRVRWMDEYLTWNPEEYGGVDHIWIPAMLIWVPDIFINNFADDSFQDFMNTYAIISATGQVLWMFPAVVKTYCTLDVRHFPFDQQKCDIVFISWTFNGFKCNVTYNESEHNAVYYTPKNQEWYVDMVSVERHEKIYACCPEPYPDVTFTIHMTRRSLFYIINLIFPCLLIYAVSFLGFFLPVESGEKVNLEITILLALVVFLLIVGETLPPTPDAIPALGLLFGITMIMVSIALVMAVIVTNIFLRKDSGKRVPACLRRLIKQRLCGRPRRNSLTNKVTMAENHVNEMKIPEIELDNLSILSEIEALNGRRNNRLNNSVKRRSTVSKQPSAAELEVIEKNENEWRSLAKCVDRIFFWLFLFSSIGALVAMFSTIPQFNAT